MKSLPILLCCTLLAFGVSCSPRYNLSDTATLKDFSGKWVGEWSWDATNVTTLQISNNVLVALNFPLDKTEVLNGNAELTFSPGDSTPRGKPGVYLTIGEVPTTFALYITKNKKRLLYDVSVTEDKHIVFTRK